MRVSAPRVCTLLLCSLAATPLRASADRYAWTASGNRPPLLRSQALRALAESEIVKVTVGLRWRNPAALEQLLRELSAPQSPRFQRYLDVAEFDATFAPAPSDVAEVAEYLARSGLTVTAISPDGMLITAVGTAAAVQRAFSTRLVLYREDNRIFYAPENEPELPAEIGRQVLGVLGLENKILLHPHLAALPAFNPRSGQAPYWPQDIARAYNFDALYTAGIRGDTTRAATVAIITAYGFDPADVAAFWQTFGIERTLESVHVVPVGGRTPATHDETALDVEWASALAPLSGVVVYEGADATFGTFMELYSRAVNDNRAAVVSTSWGACEEAVPQAYLQQAHAIFQKAAALGISIVAASGDAGAYDCGPGVVSVDFPASDPLVLAAGGTSLRADLAGNFWEEAWPGSGGGQSALWPQPLWQSTAAARRGLADVAFNADPATGYYVRAGGRWQQYGGTSAAAPCWAALLALANQSRARVGLPPVGPVAPLLCELAAEESGALRDVVAGENQVYRAGPGWDALTGWGSPDAGQLVSALTAHPFSPSPDDPKPLIAFLQPPPPHSAPLVRAAFSRRCGNSALDLRLVKVDPGEYDLVIGNDLVGTIGTRGASATARFLAVDPRGKLVMLRRRDQSETVASATFPARELAPARLRARLLPAAGSTAFGIANYQAHHGRASFRVRAVELPEGEYSLIVGGEVVATFESEHAGHHTAGTVRFDTRAGAGTPFEFDPLCKRVEINRNGIPCLWVDPFPGIDGCP